MSENLIYKSGGGVVYKSSPDGLIKKLYGAKSSFVKPSERNDLAITTQTASARNDSAHNPLPLGEGGTQCRVRVKKAAFTLAEVLITLAIIGIVAALTIPTLVQNFQSRAWDTASEVFQRKLEESLKVMNVQGTLAGYTTTEAFVDELSKHIKITRICDNDDITTCFADKVTWGTENEEVEMADVKRASHFGQDSWGTNTVGVQFANGVNGVIAYNPTETCKQDPYSNQITGTSCLAILYDVDGFKNPNTQNKDLRSINVSSLGGSSCSFEVGGICFGTLFKPTALTLAECEAQKGELGINECYYEADYWAGAVKTCHDQGKRLPNDSELTTLANDLYGETIGGGDGEAVYATMNTDKASSYGIPLTDFGGGDSGFALWSGQETDARYAHEREFYSVGTSWVSNGYRDRSRPGLWAVCVGE